MRLVKSTIDYRESSDVKRNDFMNLLLQLKKNGKLEEESGSEYTDRLTLNQIAAQCFVFFLAGYETSSTTMSFCLYELARHPEVQEKLRREILSVLKKYNNVLTYEAQLSMPYLDCVINETLRLYPPVTVLQRKVDRDYRVPNHDFTFEQKENIRIPIYSIQRDSEYFEKPLEFIPERFDEENIHKIRPFTFLPFGDGPRICIGNRFGMMQTRIGIITLLKNFEFALSNKMLKELQMSPLAPTMSPKDGMWLNFKQLKKNND